LLGIGIERIFFQQFSVRHLDKQKRIRAAENRGVKKIKTSKKDDKQRGKRRPAEAAGAITQTTHNDGSSIK
jgi:hypothetical protein